MSVVNNSALSGASGASAAAAGSGYQISRSLRFNSADTSYLSRGNSGGNQKTWTWSGWVKRSGIGTNGALLHGGQGSNYTLLKFNSSDHIQVDQYGGDNFYVYTDAVFRDPSAWMHVVCAVDTTQATDSNRVKIWVNGVQQTLTAGTNWPGQNINTRVNDGSYLQRISTDASNILNAYLAEVHFLDGIAASPSDLGETDDNGVWQPKDYEGSYNGSASTITISYSSSSTSQNASTMFDGNTSTYANGALNSGSYTTITERPVTFTLNNGTFTYNTNNGGATGGTNYRYLRLTKASDGTTIELTENSTNGWLIPNAWTGISISKMEWKRWTSYENVSAVYVDGNILEDTSSNIPAGVNGFHLNFSDNSSDITLGYDTSSTSNTTDKRQNFKAVTYNGTGSSKQVSVGFKPGMVWIKSRNHATWHQIYDTIRGAGNRLFPNDPSAPDTSTDNLTAFTDQGFALGADSNASGANVSGKTYVAWCWAAGGTASTNTDGAISSQVSANQAYGFSVVKWTGNGNAATTGHGLGVAPKLIIMKENKSADWLVYTTVVDGSYDYYVLNSTGGGNNSSYSSPTSSVFTYQADNSGDAYAYCFAEIAGYSKIGTYASSTNEAQTITTGFKPAFVLIRGAGSGGYQWVMYDSTRGGANHLTANRERVEGDPGGVGDITFESNGFSIPATGDNGNIRGGGTYIYMAFADDIGNHFNVNNLTASTGDTTPGQNFKAVTYTGNAQQTAITVGFQPDLVWTKRRNGTGNHNIQDSVRGASKTIQSDYNGAEFTGNRLASFDSNGFTLTSDGGSNTNNATYVAWAWKAGGTASSNTDGTITSQVSANQAKGFSVVKWTGTASDGTVGHGLSANPGMIIVKNYGEAADWIVWHKDLANTTTQYLHLNNSNGVASGYDVWNDTAPTSSVIHVGTNGHTNSNNKGIIAYCWSEISGFSKFGSYTGTSSANYISTGFKPAFVIIRSTNGSNWHLLDSNRGSSWLEANGTSSENSNSNISITYLDNGFTVDGSNVNYNGYNYIYMAFADNLPGEGCDSLVDTPEQRAAQTDSGAGGEVVGNYATWNPLDKNSNITLSNGNLDAAETSGANHFAGRATMKYPATGKWYYEATITTLGGACCIGVDNSGLANPSLSNSGVFLILVNSSNNVQRYIGSSTTSFDSAYGNPAVGSVLQVAYDADADKLWLGMNNVWMGSGSSANGNPGAGSEATASNVSDPFPSVNLVTSALSVNFGQRSFSYAAPTNFLALNTANLPDPTIADGSTAMDATLYNGNNATAQTITGINHSPDFVWYKHRSSGSSNGLFDTVRGANQYLTSNTAAAEQTISGVTSFTNDGFTLGTDTGANGSGTWVAWTWEGGDLVTNSSYDQSAIWSGMMTSTGNGIEAANPATSGFNGILTGLGCRVNGNSSMTWTPAGGYAFTGSVIIYCAGDGMPSGNQFTCVHAGGTLDFSSSVTTGTTNTAVNLTNLGITSPITSITIASGVSNPRFSGIEIGGKLLVDTGVIPAGGLNSSVYNQTAVWSNIATLSSGSVNSSYPLTNGFDGSIYTLAEGDTTDAYIEIPISTTIASGGVRVNAAVTSNQPLYINLYNGSTNVETVTGDQSGRQWYATTYAGPITKIRIQRSGRAWEFYAVEVNGKILVDQGSTPAVNVPSISSTCRANPSAGFSITSWTGTGANATIGHGLNAAPKMVWLKRRSSVEHWQVFHTSIPNNTFLSLSDSGVNFTNPDVWNSTDPTSSAFSFISTANVSGEDFIAYCFAPVPGYSAFGSYVGNAGSSNFVHLGFKPKLLIIKRSSDGSNGWHMADTARSPGNVANEYLYADTSGQEQTNGSIDILSNGFCLKADAQTTNNSGVTYIYMAWASHPSQNARAR